MKKMSLKKGICALIVIVFILPLFGCGGSGMQERREAIDKREMEEQEEMLKEIEVHFEQVPTADAPGEDFTDVVRPPNSFRTESDINKTEDGDFGSVEYVTESTLEEIIKFYETELKKAEWAFHSKLDKSLRSYPGAVISYTKGDIDLKVDIAESKTDDGKKIYIITLKHFASRE
ncbi:MAG: hypothetical protein KAS39_03780 [Actinomycetia bacterium]|nr:hypothetical protein [Actinomycetes bacterium]